MTSYETVALMIAFIGIIVKLLVELINAKKVTALS